MGTLLGLFSAWADSHHTSEEVLVVCLGKTRAFGRAKGKPWPARSHETNSNSGPHSFPPGGMGKERGLLQGLLQVYWKYGSQYSWCCASGWGKVNSRMDVSSSAGISLGQKPGLCGFVAAVAVRLPIPKQGGIIPSVSECKMGSMPRADNLFHRSSDLNCHSRKPFDLCITNVWNVWKCRFLASLLWVVVLKLRWSQLLYVTSWGGSPDLVGAEPTSSCWLQACSALGCFCPLWLQWQKGREMIQTEETGQKCKLDHVDSQQHLIITKKTCTKPSQLWSICTSEIHLPTMLL